MACEDVAKEQAISMADMVNRRCNGWGGGGGHVTD